MAETQIVKYFKLQKGNVGLIEMISRLEVGKSIEVIDFANLQQVRECVSAVNTMLTTQGQKNLYTHSSNEKNLIYFIRRIE